MGGSPGSQRLFLATPRVGAGPALVWLGAAGLEEEKMPKIRVIPSI